ncbi:sodium/proton antiporter NhaB [Agromyces sp. Soil535]|uniref:sodium/proton antiporter NhaB n=1 Tax=Agromyces sp. Soil535 TaxID=1736390 RepID=UPI0006FC1396|nr:sodium/proton antiporter NhaB [Agromyces sp. Soil535]KRE21522.1 sodium:proton antiporter [Agromyces sp. Soil535]
MVREFLRAVTRNFLGEAPDWYKATIVAFLVLNPFVLLASGPFITGWVFVAEFIFTLVMALKCYPLQPGGLIAIEGVIIGMTSAESVYDETAANFSVILLLIFMVAGIYFLRDVLLVVFTKLLVAVRSKLMLSLTFVGATALLSAFLNALTVVAVIIAVATGLYAVYHRFASDRGFDDEHDHADDELVNDPMKGDLDRFRGFLRNIMMHAAVGTALGGLVTIVGEPQNLLIGQLVGWGFVEFLVRMLPVSLPLLIVGLLTTVLVEKTRWFGYGVELPPSVREVMERWERREAARRGPRQKARLTIQAITAVLLVVSLAFQLAEVGLVGLMVIVVATAFNGVTNEPSLGRAFQEALPFTALLVTFFAIVAVIDDQGLFTPVIDFVLAQDGPQQGAMLFVAAGALSAVTDNVFVATVYITEIAQAFDAGSITHEQFESLAIVVNAGTNIPSVATPNGQAAFLFLLTSALAPLIRLGFGRMLWMALPYTVTMTTTGLVTVALLI